MTLVINPAVGHASGPYEALWYIEPYYEQVRDYLLARGRLHAYLHRGDAVREKAWPALPSVTYVVAVGHGNTDVFTGYRLSYIFWVDMTEKGFRSEWARDRVFLMLSCLTARRLGPWMVDSLGAWSYLGWDIPYTFVVYLGRRKGADWRATPDRLFFDPVEEAFSRCATMEYAPGECYDHIYRRYTEHLQNPHVPERWKAIIRADRDHMRLLGHRDHPPGVARRVSALSLLAAAPIAALGGLIMGRESRRYGIKVF